MPDVLAPPMSISPRGYQTEAVEAVLSAYERGTRRSLISLPTGTGKTIVFALLLQQRGGRALVLAHRDELIQQAVDKLRLVDPSFDIGVVKAERDEHDAQIVVASVKPSTATPGCPGCGPTSTPLWWTKPITPRPNPTSAF